MEDRENASAPLSVELDAQNSEDTLWPLISSTPLSVSDEESPDSGSKEYVDEYTTKVPAQCGMNFISNLASCGTVAHVIRKLDYAFNHWGTGGGYGTPKAKDPKSQIIFTDVYPNIREAWQQIKEISYMGPVTINERDSCKNKIAVYILTRDAYEKWRSQHLKKHPEDSPNKLRQREKEEEARAQQALRAFRRRLLGDTF